MSVNSYRNACARYWETVPSELLVTSRFANADQLSPTTGSRKVHESKIMKERVFFGIYNFLFFLCFEAICILFQLLLDRSIKMSLLFYRGIPVSREVLIII
jgi:hypothetical protein